MFGKVDLFYSFTFSCVQNYQQIRMRLNNFKRGRETQDDNKVGQRYPIEHGFCYIRAQYIRADDFGKIFYLRPEYLSQLIKKV